MKELARSYLWWPGLDEDLEEVCRSCQMCLELRKMPGKSELHPWEWPKKPWHRLHIDYAGPMDGHYFLVIIDAHSKWCDIYRTSGPTAKATIRCLISCFRNYGLPVSIVSDNGPCFVSSEFKEFLDFCGVQHVFTATYKPSTNGLAERLVQTLKRFLKQSKEPVELALDRFLYHYRSTPHTTTGISPAELMFGRKMRTRFDLLWPSERVSARVIRKQEQQKAHHAKFPRNVSLSKGDSVMVRHYLPGKKWVPAEIAEKTGPLSYKCQLENGSVTKRHADQIIPRSKQDSRDVPPTNEEREVPEGASHAPPVVVPEKRGSPGKLAIAQSPIPLRRSARVRKPVARMDL